MKYRGGFCGIKWNLGLGTKKTGVLSQQPVQSYILISKILTSLTWPNHKMALLSTNLSRFPGISKDWVSQSRWFYPWPWFSVPMVMTAHAWFDFIVPMLTGNGRNQFDIGFFLHFAPSSDRHICLSYSSKQRILPPVTYPSGCVSSMAKNLFLGIGMGGGGAPGSSTLRSTKIAHLV